MEPRSADGSVGDTDYSEVSSGYARFRRAEPQIEAEIRKELGSAQSVLNVGAGPGSYEPRDRNVTAVEPSSTMRSRRSPELAVAVDAHAEALPFVDESFDAAMTTFSVQQWSSAEAGLKEMRRVTRGPVIVLTCDPDLLSRFWLNDYSPEVIEVQARRYPSISKIVEHLGAQTHVRNVPIPLNCTDGFDEAYYGRPEMFLDREARHASSAWSFLDDESEERFVSRLTRDIESGEWDRRFNHLRSQLTFEGSLVLVTSNP